MDHLSSEHRSTGRVLDILLLLSQKQEGYTLAEISREMKAPKSSLFPIIHTMEAKNFLLYKHESGKYCIGRQAYWVGSSYVSERPVYDFLQNELKLITEECQETCHLGILAGGNVLYIAKKEAIHPIMLRSHVGQQLPAYCTGIGKALLTGCSEDELKLLYPEELPAFTSNTITRLELLKQEIHEVKNTGFAYEHAELTEGITCIAVPLCCRTKVIAAISICVPVFRFSDQRKKELQILLQRIKKEIEDFFQKFSVDDSSFLF